MEKEPGKKQGSGLTDAVAFLDAVDRESHIQDDVKNNADTFVKMGEKHGYHFTAEELDEALRQHWGLPEKRKHHQHPYTCSCFSEPPGL